MILGSAVSCAPSSYTACFTPGLLVYYPAAMLLTTAVNGSAIQFNGCHPSAAPQLAAPKPSAAPSSTRPATATVSEAVRSSIRRFLLVSDPDRTNMLDVYRQLRSEYGEEAVSKSKLAIRNVTKSILDDMAAAAQTAEPPTAVVPHINGMNGTVRKNSDVPPQVPIVLPLARTSQPQPAPQALQSIPPSMPLPPPVWSVSHSEDTLPALEFVPSQPHSPSVSQPQTFSPTASRSHVALPTLPLANGQAHPSPPSEVRAEREEREGLQHSSSGDVAAERNEEEKRVEDSEEEHEETAEQGDDESDSESSNHSSEDEADEQEEEEERQEKRKKSTGRSNGRSSKKRKPNKPLAIDSDTGAETWEVRAIHRSDFDDRGEKVYKVSWYNWTGWPRHSWLRRNEWIGRSRAVEKFEAEEKKAQEREQKRAAWGAAHRHGKKRKLTGHKDHKGDITAQTSWEFDQKKLREFEEQQTKKRQREREAERTKQKTKKVSTKAKAVAADKKAKQRVRVKKEEDAEGAVEDDVPLTAEEEQALVEMARAEAQKRREERKRFQDEEDGRSVPFVRADGRFLIPWSSDEEAEVESKAVQEESEISSQQRKRRERRRLLRLHQLSDLLLHRSHGAARSSDVRSDVHADGGASDGTSEDEEREVQEDAEVSVHESELTSEASEAEMDQWRAERVYRVEALIDHRRVGGQSSRELQRLKQRDAERKRREVEKPAPPTSKRMNAFQRAQQRLQEDATHIDEQKEAPTAEQTEMMEEESKEGVGVVEDVLAVADGGEAVGGDDEADDGGCGPLEYLVRWSGRGDKQRSWEPEKHLKQGCKLLLRDYKLMVGLTKDKHVASRGGKRKRRSRT